MYADENQSRIMIINTSCINVVMMQVVHAITFINMVGHYEGDGTYSIIIVAF